MYQQHVREPEAEPPQHLKDIMERWPITVRRIVAHDERVLGAAASADVLIPQARMVDRAETRRGAKRQRTELVAHGEWTPACYEKCKNHRNRAFKKGYASIEDYALNCLEICHDGKTWRECLPAEHQSVEMLRWMDQVAATKGNQTERWKPEDVRQQRWPKQFHLELGYGKAGGKFKNAVPLAKNPMTRKFGFTEQVEQDRAGIPRAKRQSAAPKGGKGSGIGCP